MYAISTVWNAWRHTQVEPLLAELESLGFEQIELSAWLSPSLAGDIISWVRKGRIRVPSVHNFCPAPYFEGSRKKDQSILSLSHPDERIRAWAVRQTLHTLDIAKVLGAKAIVLHLGEVRLSSSSGKIFALAEAGETKDIKYEKLKVKLRQQRAARKGPYLERALKSLSRIVSQAEDLGVRVGIETRYYLEEIPSLDEVGFFLKQISSPILGYWHDVGHAQVRENLKWEEHQEYLRRYGEYLIGMHIHDVVGTRDHKAPLEGEFDFRRVKEFLRRDIIKVLEIHPASTAEDIKQGLAYLREIEKEP